MTNRKRNSTKVSAFLGRTFYLKSQGVILPMHIEISPTAKQQLLAITDYYAEWGGLRSVENLINKITDKQNRILKFPKSYPIEPLLAERDIAYRSAIINSHYKMIYRIDGEIITISAFWDMRMDPRKLKQMTLY